MSAKEQIPDKKETSLLLSNTKVSRKQRDWLDAEAERTEESIAFVVRTCINEMMKKDKK